MGSDQLEDDEISQPLAFTQWEEGMGVIVSTVWHLHTAGKESEPPLVFSSEDGARHGAISMLQVEFREESRWEASSRYPGGYDLSMRMYAGKPYVRVCTIAPAPMYD